MRNSHSILVTNPEGKRSLGRPRRRWENTLGMDLNKCVDWIHWAENLDLVGCCENGNKPSTSIKGGEFRDHLRDS